jgi:hypothetical protein
VVGGEQVIVCPECQVSGWTDGLDACPSCGSTWMVKRLGDVECRACRATVVRGATRTGGPSASAPGATEQRAQLAGEVSAALDRMLGRGTALVGEDLAAEDRRAGSGGRQHDAD